MLDEILSRLQQLPPKQLEQTIRGVLDAKKKLGLRWIPNTGPQTLAYHSEADILLFGGEPGGGKTQLILGLAFNEQERSLIMRRQYTDLDSIIDGALEINGTRDGFNGSPPPRLKFESGVIDFGAAAKIGDEQHWMGRPHDFLGIDEATQFTAKQIRFLRGWLRTTTKGQRTRTVLATNPPLSAEGLWVHEMFAPWLNPQHPNPAKPGELRWFVVDQDDRDIEVDGPGEYVIEGKSYSAESRTFIPSKLTDNPYLDAKDYQKRLDSLPAQDREILLGGFKTSFRDQDRQLIPTAWIVAAQKRWTPKPPEGVPQCAIGADVASGGEDSTVLSKRHDAWFAELVITPGKETPLGSDVAGLIFSHLRDDAIVGVDMGGGYGGAPMELLAENKVRTFAYKGSEGSSARTKDGKMKFFNVRTEAHWRLREALDPDQPGGSPVALPPDPILLADLTAPVFWVTTRGYQITTKEDLCEKLGRSPDRGDAVAIANFVGEKIANVAGGKFPKRGRRGKDVTVNLGRFGTRRH